MSEFYEYYNIPNAGFLQNGDFFYKTNNFAFSEKVIKFDTLSLSYTILRQQR